MALSIVARRRPFALLAPGFASTPGSEERPTPRAAPFATVRARVADARTGRVSLRLRSGDVLLTGEYDAARGAAWVTVTDATGRTTRHRSLRHGRARGTVDAVALTLTGTWVTVWTSGDGDGWTARARAHLEGRVDPRSERFLAGLHSGAEGSLPVRRLATGGFGQLGLRDVRLVSEADGTPVRRDGRLLLSATSAGPGFFDTGHTSVWSLEEDRLRLRHEADLFFRRPDRPGVFGDHATHVVRDGAGWLVATSTWGDFVDGRRPDASVGVTLAETTADVTTGVHVLDTTALALPTNGLTSAGVWDPHLVRVDGEWLVGFVSATRFFRFHPAIAAGPTLRTLRLRSAATDRTATEGTTLVRLDEGWRVLASDGRDGGPGLRERYPVFDLDLRETGTLAAPYPTNLPWPTLARSGDHWLMVTFDGRPRGGRLLGYGTHGDVVLLTGDDVR
ncbi:MAG: hypothetical protein U0R80_02220 [Nocardioidaceae bacterium]